MVYYVKMDKKQKEDFAFDATLTGFCKSYAGADTKWEEIPKGGARLAAGDHIYLQYQLSAKEDTYEENTVTTEELCFGGNTAEESVLSAIEDNCNAAIYKGSGSGETYMTLNLVSGEGSAYLEWD